MQEIKNDVYDVELSINDKNIPLNDFLDKILSKTVIGMLSALKTGFEYNEIKNIEIKIKKN
ncbi:MAG: hypothetical protein QMC67_14725 [Candidatus Wallbacteria bacterium]